MIIDAFMFFNEVELLEGRLEYLYDTVDVFLIAESNITHSGKPKAYNYRDNQLRYIRFEDKIRYIQVELDPAEFATQHLPDQTDYSSAHWQIENLQRNRLQSVLAEYPADSVVMISDLDEIPNRNRIADAAALAATGNATLSFEQRAFYYNFHQYQVAPWPGTVISRLDQVLGLSVQHFRDNRYNFPRIADGGVHLSYWGGAERIQTKLASFAHQEYNRSEYTALDTIAARVARGEDLFGRDNPFAPARMRDVDPDVRRIFGGLLKPLDHHAYWVEGFFTDQDFEFYRFAVAQAPAVAHFVEVGSFKGRSSSYMAVEIARSLKCIDFDCVDTWQGSEEHQVGAQFADADVIENRLLEKFIQNMEPAKGYYRPIQATSLEASQLYDNDSIDFVFIDAAHDYDNVKADILAWLPKVKPGGIVSGHDWPHPPVKQAVIECLGLVQTMGDCWYCRR
jgi:beta-1,4-mannosyl-glycoprotein beta-1,4-N-acetylglucosaminyltransferase